MGADLQNELVKQAALADLCQLAESSSGLDVARRSPFFADESGAAWAAATSVCLDEVCSPSHPHSLLFQHPCLLMCLSIPARVRACMWPSGCSPRTPR